MGNAFGSHPQEGKIPIYSMRRWFNPQFGRNFRTLYGIVYECTKYNAIRDVHRSGMILTAGFLGAERVLKRPRGVRGQENTAETGRRANP